MIKSLPVDSPKRRRLPPLLRRAWYALNQAFRRRISSTGLTPDQFTILRWLSESPMGNPTQRQLCELMESDPNTIAAVLQRMETAGWVERKTHERDRRAYRIQMTAHGKKIYGRTRKMAVRLQTQILEALPKDKQEEFLKQLEVIANACYLAAREER